MIIVENLEKKFEDFVAVASINFTVAKGEVMALLGPNGAGKTTTIRMLTSILKPTNGHAIVNGFDVETHSKHVRSSVGVLTENHGLYYRMPAYEYLDFFGQLYGMPIPVRRQRVPELFEQFGMTAVMKKRVGEFSKGMRQKLALARSLLHNPSVLLLDEPTSAMDPESSRLVRNMIKNLQNEERTILICTHNLAEAEELSDRITIIREGKIIESGSPGELRNKLLGSPLYEIRYSKCEESLDKKIFELVDVVREDHSGFQYVCENPEVINPIILKMLIDQGYKIIYAKEVPRSLEKLYLHAVGNGETHVD